MIESEDEESGEKTRLGDSGDEGVEFDPFEIGEEGAELEEDDEGGESDDEGGDGDGCKRGDGEGEAEDRAEDASTMLLRFPEETSLERSSPTASSSTFLQFFSMIV